MKRDPLAPDTDQPVSGRFLVVDDDPGVRRYVVEVLSRAGHGVSAVGDVEDGLAALIRDTPDAAFLDVDLSGRSGLDLLEAMRARNLPTVGILLTGTVDVGIAVEGMKLGAIECIQKPVDPTLVRWAASRALVTAQSRVRAKALERVAQEWAFTFDSCPDILLVLDASGRILRANETAARRAGLSVFELAWRPITDAYPGGLGAAVEHARLHPGESDGGTVQVLDHKLKSRFWLTVNALRVASGGTGTVVVARDVTDLVRSEEARKGLLRELLTAQEAERRRIAQELHDGIGQVLVSLRVGLMHVAEGVVVEDLRTRLLELARCAGTALEETRRMSHGLRPSVLDDLGLVTALTRLAEDCSRSQGVQVEMLLPTGDPGRLPSEVESTVYRVAQEALANIVKHSQAQTADIVFEVNPGILRLSIADDGCGFPESEIEGFGVSGMRERASLLGGSFRIMSTHGRGTTVDLCLPLSSE